MLKSVSNWRTEDKRLEVKWKSKGPKGNLDTQAQDVICGHEVWGRRTAAFMSDKLLSDGLVLILG